MAWMPISAWPRRPSRRASPETCEPSPGSGSKAQTSKTPPSVLWSWPAALIAAFMRSDASASRQRTGLSSTPSKSSIDEVVAHRDGLGADAHHVAADLGAVAAQQRLRDAARRHPCRRLARAGPLEDRAQVVGAVLEHPGQVGVPGPRQRDGLDLALRLPHRHAVGRPVGEVEVRDLERQRAADRQAVAQARLHLHPVALDLHAPAAAVAELAAREVGVDVVGREREPGRKPLEHREERRAVGLPGCAVRQGHGARV